jgi:hypothetical protein
MCQGPACSEHRRPRPYYAPVEDDGHHLIGGHEVVCVEGINHTRLGLAEGAGAT